MTKHFSRQSVSETAKSDAWAALNIVSLYPTPELRRIMKKRQSLLDAVSEQILMATTRSYTPTKSKWITDSVGIVRRFQVPIQLKSGGPKSQMGNYTFVFCQRQAFGIGARQNRN